MPGPTCYSSVVDELTRFYVFLLRALIIVIFVPLVLYALAGVVGWYWPCDWAWQPFGHFNPNCGLEYGPVYGD